jgi:hypothetical protein
MFSANKKEPTTIGLSGRDNAPALQSIPDDVIGLISSCKYLPDVSDVVHMACTSRFLYNKTQIVLPMRKLAHCVVVHPSTKNKEIVIDAMLANSSLMQAKVNAVVDRTGRRVIVNKTLFQLAYGACDGDFCKAMKDVFILHCRSEQAAIAEIERQRNEMLESKEEHQFNEAVCKTQLQELLAPVIAAIHAEQFNNGEDAKKRLILSPETLVAIEEFRVAFAETQLKVNDKGMHFRNSLLQEVYDMYANLAAPVQWNYNYNKCVLFEDAVISTLQSYVSPNIAQDLSQGLSYLQRANNPEAARREHKLRDGSGNYYDVVNGDSSAFVLSGCCVDIYYGGASFCGVASRWGWPGAHALAFSKLTSNKCNKLAELMLPQPRPSKASACVIL